MTLPVSGEDQKLSKLGDCLELEFPLVLQLLAFTAREVEKKVD
jgi:hypothetical protein